MSFTYDLSTDVGQLRLAIFDTGGVAPGETAAAGSYGFHDAELDYFLTEGGSRNEGIILALRTLLVDGARRERAFSLPGTTYDDRGRVRALKEALRLYGGDLPTASVIMPAVLPFDSGYVEQPEIVTS